MTGQEPYVMRGGRVAPLSPMRVEQVAKGFCIALKLSKRTKRFDLFFESLFKYNIALNVVCDEEWEEATFGLTYGHYDHTDLTISVPNYIYEQACRGEQFGLSVIFHELGHLFLSHKPMLHRSKTVPSMLEDAEWQADKFSDVLLERVGFNPLQLSLDFCQ